MIPPPSETFPAELVLRPSRSRAVARFLLALLVTIGYLWLLGSYFDCLLMWMLAAACFLFTAAALRRLLDRTACLRLTSKGFAAYDPAAPVIFEWGEVQRFRAGPRGKMVVFDLVGGIGASIRGAQLARFVAGGDGALPDTYGMTASELAQLLNQWRDHYAPPVEPLDEDCGAPVA